MDSNNSRLWGSITWRQIQNPKNEVRWLTLVWRRNSKRASSSRSLAAVIMFRSIISWVFYISLRDLQNESSLDLAEKRAECQAVSPTGKCDRLTVNLLRLMLPPDHADYSSFHPEGFMDLCTYEVLQHATRLRMNAEEREALLAMTPEERAAIGDHLMTIDELNARAAKQAKEDS